MGFEHHSGFKRETGRVAGFALGLTAAGLMGIIALSLGSLAGADELDGAMPSRPIPTLASAPALNKKNNGFVDITKVLARPLFSSSRRPADVASPIANLPKSMPRLTGVVVSPAGRFALFANADGDRPLVLSEGDHFGAAVIEAIAAGEVTVRGPDGAFVLRSTFNGDAAPAKLLMPTAPKKPEFRQLPIPFRAASRVARAN